MTCRAVVILVERKILIMEEVKRLGLHGTRDHKDATSSRSSISAASYA
jgi:hypothetical protein